MVILLVVLCNAFFEFIENVLLAPFVFKFLSFFKKSLAVRSVKDSIDND